MMKMDDSDQYLECECGKKFYGFLCITMLTFHKIFECNIRPDPPVDETGVCVLCGKYFASELAMQSHQGKAHGPRDL